MILDVTSSEVEYPRITSTNFITGTGFMKCIPITLSALEVTAAILVIEIEEVLVARMQESDVFSSICLNIFNFKSMFSVAASTTSSAFLTPAARSVLVLILAKVLFLSSSVIFSFFTIRSRFLEIVAKAFSRADSEMSISVTLKLV